MLLLPLLGLPVFPAGIALLLAGHDGGQFGLERCLCHAAVLAERFELFLAAFEQRGPRGKRFGLPAKGFDLPLMLRHLSEQSGLPARVVGLPLISPFGQLTLKVADFLRTVVELTLQLRRVLCGGSQFGRSALPIFLDGFEMSDRVGKPALDSGQSSTCSALGLQIGNLLA